MITDKEAAERIGVTRRWLRENVAIGPRRYELNQKTIRYRPDDVDAWLAVNPVGGPTQQDANGYPWDSRDLESEWPQVFVEELRLRLNEALGLGNPDECWVADVGSGASAYPKLTFKGGVHRAHRLSYRAFKGPIPNGLSIDHLCNERYCWNPDHLEAVTPGENSARGSSTSGARRTQCRKGHPFTPDNTYYLQNGGGAVARKCRECTLSGRPGVRRKCQKMPH